MKSLTSFFYIKKLNYDFKMTQCPLYIQIVNCNDHCRYRLFYNFITVFVGLHTGNILYKTLFHVSYYSALPYTVHIYIYIYKLTNVQSAYTIF